MTTGVWTALVKKEATSVPPDDSAAEADVELQVIPLKIPTLQTPLPKMTPSADVTQPGQPGIYHAMHAEERPCNLSGEIQGELDQGGGVTKTPALEHQTTSSPPCPAPPSSPESIPDGDTETNAGFADNDTVSAIAIDVLLGSSRRSSVLSVTLPESPRPSPTFAVLWKNRPCSPPKDGNYSDVDVYSEPDSPRTPSSRAPPTDDDSEAPSSPCTPTCSIGFYRFAVPECDPGVNIPTRLSMRPSFMDHLDPIPMRSFDDM